MKKIIVYNQRKKLNPSKIKTLSSGIKLLLIFLLTALVPLLAIATNSPTVKNEEKAINHPLPKMMITKDHLTALASGPTCSDNADAVTSPTDITNPNNALGSPNGNFAELYNDADIDAISYSKVAGPPIPEVEVFAIQPSCVDGVSQNDGYLQLSSVSDGTHYNFSTGTTYSGSTNINNATAFNIATDLPLQFGTIANPSGSQDYTIRVFNTESDCFTDVVVTMNEQDCTIGCDCTEFIYLNDTDADAVHKFEVMADSTLNEILVGGNSWYPGTSSSELPSPHGLGIDLNANIYIAERAAGDIRKFRCDGEIVPANDFEISGYGGTNFGMIDNLLLVNDRGSFNSLEVFDVCTEALVGTICFSNSANVDRQWGFYLDPRDNTIYYSIYENVNGGEIFKATLDDLNSGSCVTPFIQRGITEPVVGDNFLSNTLSPFGMTTDQDGNLYVVMSPRFPDETTQIFKYSPSGMLLARSILDNDGLDGTVGRFSRGLGVVFSETSNLLYISNNTDDSDEDCISVFETTSSATDSLLSYVGTGFANPPSGSGIAQLGKGIGIGKECCPTNNNISIDTILCSVSINDTIFLQELVNCNGTICEGLWEEGSNTGLTYNSCNNSMTINSLDACGSFTIESDGTGSSAQCGAFKITVNIEVGEIIAPVIAGDQSICPEDDPAAFTITTAASGNSAITYQWQSSTTDCSTGFSDITDATNATYDPPSTLTNTTYYRVLSSVSGCNSGICQDTSNCLTITVFPTPSANAGTDVAICNGSSTNLSASGGTSYAWSPMTGLNDDAIANPTANPTTTTTYTITVTDANNCTATDEVVVTVNPNPTATAMAIPPTCPISGTMPNSDGMIKLTSFPTGATYQYSAGSSFNSGSAMPGSAASVPADSLLVSNLANPASAMDYTVRVFDMNNCFVDVTVTLNPTDCSCTNPIIDALVNESICFGDSFTASNVTTDVTNGIAVTYQWYNNNGTDNSGTAAISGQTTATLTTLPTAVGSYSYQVIATNANNSTCSASQNITLIIHPNPTVAVADVLKCTSNSEILTATASGGMGSYDYLWTGPFISNPGNVASFSTSVPGIYTVQLTDDNNCTATASGELTFQSKVCLPVTFTIRRGQ